MNHKKVKIEIFNVHKILFFSINFKKLKKKHIDFIKSLPNKINLKIGNKKTIITHGAPWQIDFYFYKNTKKKWINEIKKYDKDIFILGHTHYPMKLKLKNNITILNPGSIGQPRNGSNRACWAIIDDKNTQIEFMKTKYPLKNLIKSIKKNDKNNKSLLKYFL